MTDTEKFGVNELVDKLNIKEDEIVELLKENSKLEGKLADLTSEYYELENFKNNEIAELKAQIEKMKLCQNCKFADNDFMEEPCRNCSRCLGEDIKREGTSDKWEI